MRYIGGKEFRYEEWSVEWQQWVILSAPYQISGCWHGNTIRMLFTLRRRKQDRDNLPPHIKGVGVWCGSPEICALLMASSFLKQTSWGGGWLVDIQGPSASLRRWSGIGQHWTFQPFVAQRRFARFSYMGTIKSPSKNFPRKKPISSADKNPRYSLTQYVSSPSTLSNQWFARMA